ncbi:hypothetical protein EC844_11518 [Acinetobacter calcoaceticus]|uniref:Uncharacterized protein n=1 Tax=Acinetobacter calcoaceticus TaxID=471 RepID=A0A4R1XS73_ACICA|nr:hypothetical protein EC844_11518 [Acinetobacter calcoaceticus]
MLDQRFEMGRILTEFAVLWLSCVLSSPRAIYENLATICIYSQRPNKLLCINVHQFVIKLLHNVAAAENDVKFLPFITV